MRRLLWLCTFISAACSSSTDERQTITSTPEAYCQSACRKAHTCNDATDQVACRTACQTELAAQPKLRADFLGYVAGCIESATCSSTSAAKCKNEAEAQLAASKYGRTFCADYVSSGAQCDPGGSEYPDTTCLKAAKSYEDSALQSANGCLAQSCATLSACLLRAIPDVTLAATTN